MIEVRTTSFPGASYLEAQLKKLPNRELLFSATAALADLGVAETCKVTTCQPHLHVVRRGEWNEYFLIHSIANGALAFWR